VNLRANNFTHGTDVIMREIPGRASVRGRRARPHLALATGPLGLYDEAAAGMASQYRIERDRGTKECAQQLTVLREK
jgi:hypothetical protein